MATKALCSFPSSSPSQYRFDNVLSIAAMSMYATATRLQWSVLLRRIFLNPLILSLAAGFLCRSTGLEVPGSLMAVLELMPWGLESTSTPRVPNFVPS